mmetsp:Transcript_51494/g.111828  ORF Transcript_51494/g.111828 Transcript_51494/m.111828 type:complete len:245 (+) Transcript_51494:147-881(+)
MRARSLLPSAVLGRPNLQSSSPRRLSELLLPTHPCHCRAQTIPNKELEIPSPNRRPNRSPAIPSPTNPTDHPCLRPEILSENPRGCRPMRAMARATWTVRQKKSRGLTRFLRRQRRQATASASRNCHICSQHTAQRSKSNSRSSRMQQQRKQWRRRLQQQAPLCHHLSLLRQGPSPAYLRPNMTRSNWRSQPATNPILGLPSPRFNWNKAPACLMLGFPNRAQKVLTPWWTAGRRHQIVLRSRF